MDNIKKPPPKRPNRKNRRLDSNRNEFDSEQGGKKTGSRRNLRNPYIYTGALDPVKNRQVCVPRNEELKLVRAGASKGDYWAVLGPRQIGKTTFLRQLAKDLSEKYYTIYITLQTSPQIEKNFYNWLQEKLLEKDGLELTGTNVEWRNDKEPHMKFLYLLENLKIKDSNRKKKIILLLDEIEGAPHIKKFLHLWRTVYERRDKIDGLKKYVVIIAGSSTFFEFTTKPTSPYNISKPLFLKELSEDGVEKLIKVAFNQGKKSIDTAAKEELLRQTSGHPQLLQHALHILFNLAPSANVGITKRDVDNSIELLLTESLNLSTLKLDLKHDDVLKNLLRDILNGTEKKFHPYQEYSISGVGAIIEKKSSCEIRNELYRRVIRDVLGNNEIKPPLMKLYRISIKKFVIFFSIVLTIIVALFVLFNSLIGSIAKVISVLFALVISIGLSIETKKKDKDDEKD